MSDQTWPLFRKGQLVYHQLERVQGRVVAMKWDGILWSVTIRVDDPDPEKRLASREIVAGESAFSDRPTAT